jgi:5'(3')-deoxyribonucleotidase
MEIEKKRIGVDIDDTLFDFVGSFIEYANKVKSFQIKREDFVTYSFDEVLKLPSMREAIGVVFNFYDSDFFKKMPPLPDSLNTIKSLKQKFDLYIVTSRPDYLYNATMTSLWNNFRGFFSEVYFSSNHYTGEKNSGKSKAEICLTNGISIIIEDSLEYSLQCAEKGIEAILIDAPWNQNGERKGITRVKNWKEILEKLEVKE